MNIWEMSRIAVAAERATGLTVRQEFDLELIPEILHRMGKPFLSPILDPAKNDFTPANNFWLIGEIDGEPVMAGGVRLDDLRSLDVKRFWSRILTRGFSENPKAAGPEFPSDILFGRVAYFGDLFSAGKQGLTKSGREKLRLFTTIGHFLTYTEFQPDVTYSFIQDRDMVRGTPAVYGFLDLHPFLFDWKDDPYPTGYPEWIASTPRRKIPQLMAGSQRFIEGLSDSK